MRAMPHETRTVRPGPRPDRLRAEDGALLTPPEGWALLPPGDAMLTRRVKAAGPHWVVQEQKGRKMFSRGLWAPAETIERERRRVEREKMMPGYQKKLDAGRVRRDREQTAYVRQFEAEVIAFLAFDARYAAEAKALATRVTAHATPVGSGTVARTERIPVGQRAEAAVIAWMRHQTTAYDNLQIPRVKGMRRDVRRMLAERSRALLEIYRRGTTAPETCPLRRALAQPAESNQGSAQ